MPIHSVGVSSAALHEQPLDETVHKTGDFFTQFYCRPERRSWAEINEQTVKVRSEWSMLDRNGRPREFHLARTTVYQSCTNPSVNDNPEVIGLKWTHTETRGYVSDADISAKMKGGRLCDYVMVIFHTVNYNVRKEAALMLTGPFAYFDNTGMYAKLLGLALTRMMFNLSKPAITWLPWTGKHVHFVNLDNPALTSSELCAPITEGHIVFFERVDYYNILLVYTLADGGRRFSVAADTQAPSSRFLHFDAIEVTVYMHGEAPPAPEPCCPEAWDLINFAVSMAQSRGEQEALIKGLYLASVALGIDYPAQVVPAAAVRRPYNALLSGGDFTSARPRDYNVLLRKNGIVPPPPNKAVMDELNCWIPLEDKDKLRASASLCALMSNAVTAVCSSLHITKSALIDWHAGVDALPHTGTHMRANLLRQLSHPDIRGAMMIRLASQFCRNIFGFKVPSTTFSKTHWLPRKGTFPGPPEAVRAQALQIYNQFPGGQFHAPRLGSAMSVINWYREYPLETGLCKPGSKLDITRECSRFGPESGWYEYMGNADQIEMVAASNFPNRNISYGFAALQAMLMAAQSAEPAQMPTVKFERVNWMPGRRSSAPIPRYGPVTEIAEMVPDRIEIDGSHIYEPYSGSSFDWVGCKVIAPVILFNDENNKIYKRLTYSILEQDVGILREVDAPNTDMPVLEPPTSLWSGFFNLPEQEGAQDDEEIPEKADAGAGETILPWQM